MTDIVRTVRARGKTGTPVWSKSDLREHLIGKIQEWQAKYEKGPKDEKDYCLGKRNTYGILLADYFYEEIA